ncbi:single-stranded DNA binding protein [uncultured Caudovirales phage]|uniref:Single-stranded DNA-binding protein n=1 Tax=uncultured Caudovirales phage TaxID=2100421 RepID=A0A6J7WTP4_9CAUD|nr:single-stranded DNA binding protein [uncultured Caudovirales phage]
MTNSFDALRQNRKSNFEKLTAELTKANSNFKQDSSDDNQWKPDVDKAGNGYAVIRFLPAPAGEDVPFVRIWDHGFQGDGGWYIEKSLTTLNKPDPVSEYNTKLWNSGIEANKDIVRKQKRRLSYYSNIYVVKDPTRPENEGKVFIYKYGKKIFDKINEAMHPQFSDEKPINPFDLWEGANFKLKIRNVADYRNYDKSEFDSAGPLLDDDAKLEEVWKSEHSLQELVDPKNFKSYDELKARLERALGVAESAPKQSYREEEAAPPPQKSAPAPTAATATAPWDDEEDDDLSFFKKLAKD